MLTKEEVLRKTIDLIKKYGRASKAGRCQYLVDGKMCAFGLWLEDPGCFNYWVAAYSLLLKHGQFILKEEVRHIKNIVFWNSLQNLHDADENWGPDNALTREGRDFIKNTFDVCIED